MNRLIFLLIIGLIVLSLLMPWLLTRPAIIEAFDYSKSGQIGDTIGGILNPILSGITIILIFITFINQRTELSESRRLYIDQRFESAFFNLLANQDKIVDKISFPLREVFCWLNEHPIDSGIYQNGVINGVNFFEIAANDWDVWYDEYGGVNQFGFHSRDIQTIYNAFLIEDPNKQTPAMDESIKRIKFKYKIFYEIYHVYFGNYFRHLYYILKFIDESEISDKDKIRYSGVLQSKFTSGELRMIFYNGLCFDKMKTLINRYSIVKNLAINDLTDHVNHINLYESITLRWRTEIISE